MCVCERESATLTHCNSTFFQLRMSILLFWKIDVLLFVLWIEIPLAGINLKVFYKKLLKFKTKGIQKIPPPKKQNKRRLGPRYDPPSAILSVHICWRYCFWVFFTFQGVSQGDFSLPSPECFFLQRQHQTIALQSQKRSMSDRLYDFVVAIFELNANVPVVSDVVCLFVQTHNTI